ncbi:hypothetical protein F5Y05DRAFT_422676 [Hypoxylon sp. FL0543]|nr:hypothetical protein F5Y05DRAFT_422676 [Hypoxylon sp. FL0543]
MYQLPFSRPNLFALGREIKAAGSRDVHVFPSRFDGTTMSDAQREAKASADEHCDWRGDSPEPELDDLAHNEDSHGIRSHDEVCSWRGDSPEPELDDLAHHSNGKESTKLSPKSGATSDAGPHPVQTEPEYLSPPPKAESPKDHGEISKKPESPEDHGQISKSPKENAPQAPPAGWFCPRLVHDNQQSQQPSSRKMEHEERSQEERGNEEKGRQVPDNAGITPQEGFSLGLRQALDVFQSIVKSSRAQPAPSQSEEAESSKGRKQSTQENDIPPEPVVVPLIPTMVEPQLSKRDRIKEDKAKAKREKEEAKKAQKERKAREKEEKRRLRKEKEAVRKNKPCRCKGKKTDSSPPELPARNHNSSAAEPHVHPGCHMCQHPEDEGTLDFMREIIGSAQTLASFNDIVNAAKRYLGMKGTAEPQPTQQAEESSRWNDEELVQHIAAHIHKHMHQYYDLDSPRGDFRRTPPRKTDLRSTQDEGSAGPGIQTERSDNGGTTSHGLDGNGDWPTSVMQGHILRSREPMSTPDITLTQPPSRDYSPCRAPTGRCVSPWCEQLGFKMEDPVPSFPSRSTSCLRRGFNSSPSRLRSVVTTPCAHTPICPHRPYHKSALYACVPVSVVPALDLETPYCGHHSCHSISPFMTPASISHTPYPLFNYEPHSIAETIPGTPRRSVSASG